MLTTSVSLICNANGNNGGNIKSEDWGHVLVEAIQGLVW